jgi:uncharacterized protein (PEP-CTERM system associated)
MDRARVKGYLDYGLTGVVYARDSDRNEIQNALNAFATAELLENRAFVDVLANVSQQAISAFGVQSSDPTLPNANRTEVATVSVSPYLQGPIGRAEYEARLRYTDTRSEGSGVGDSTLASALLHLDSGAMLRNTEVFLDLSRHVSDYADFRKTTQDILRTGAAWRVSPELRLTALVGREANDFTTADQENYDVYGGGVRWTPSERAELDARAEHRFFGTSHEATFRYRTPRTALVLTDSRDVSTNQDVPGTGRGTAYDLFFLQFATVQPDPILRQQAVNDFLRTHNISPTSPVLLGFLSSAVTLENRQEASFAWLGRRSTVTLTATRSESTRLDALSAANDDLSLAEKIRQRGVALTLSHRLTPLSSALVLLSHQKTSGSAPGQESTLRSFNVSWSTELGQRTSLAIGARHAAFDSPTVPYDETAVFGTFTLQF